MSKYKFTGETKSVFDIELHQIVAVVDFGDVRTGDVGGWIESEKQSITIRQRLGLRRRQGLRYATGIGDRLDWR